MESKESLKKEVESNVEAICGEESMEIKQALIKLGYAIVDKDDNRLEVTNKVMQVLCSISSALFKFKSSKSEREISSSSIIKCETGPIPNEFRCPYSNQVMNDPVTLASGVTYNRKPIQEYLDKPENDKCPNTNELLAHRNVTPNHLLGEMILQWLNEHQLKIRAKDKLEYNICKQVLNKERSIGNKLYDTLIQDSLDKLVNNYMYPLLQKISSPYFNVQSEATEELLSITEEIPLSSVYLGENEDFIALLLNPLLEGTPGTPPDGTPPDILLKFHGNLITIFTNMSDNWKNKILMAENSIAIFILVKSLEVDNEQIRLDATKALFRLSELNVNKHVICELGAFKSLVGILEGIMPVLIKDLVLLIKNLCGVKENIDVAVSQGVVRGIIKVLRHDVFIDDCFAILQMLSIKKKAIEEMAKSDEAVSCLVRYFKMESLKGSTIIIICNAILQAIFVKDPSQLKKLLE